MKPIKKPTKGKTATERQRTRRARLDAVAHRLGFGTWTKLETAVLAGAFTIVSPRAWPDAPTKEKTGATTGAGQG